MMDNRGRCARRVVATGDVVDLSVGSITAELEGGSLRNLRVAGSRGGLALGQEGWLRLEVVGHGADERPHHRGLRPR